MEKLRSEKEQLSSTRQQEAAQEAQALTRECQSLQSQNQEMLQKVLLTPLVRGDALMFTDLQTSNTRRLLREESRV